MRLVFIWESYELAIAKHSRMPPIQKTTLPLSGNHRKGQGFSVVYRSESSSGAPILRAEHGQAIELFDVPHEAVHRPADSVRKSPGGGVPVPVQGGLSDSAPPPLRLSRLSVIMHTKRKAISFLSLNEKLEKAVPSAGSPARTMGKIRNRAEVSASHAERTKPGGHADPP